MRFGTGTTVKDFSTYGDWLRRAEGSGFDLLTTGDSQSLWAEPLVTMMYAAAHTTAPRLGITVSNPMTRHPAVTASALLAIQQVAGGRFVHGLSSGDSALRNIGVRPSTVAELGDYVRALKALCAGEPAAWGDGEATMRWDARPVPIWLAAEGPRTQRLAGEVADGLVLSNSLVPEVLEVAMANIAAGAEAAGRDVADIEIWHMANLVFAPTEAEGIESIKSVLAGTANHVYRFHMDGKVLPDDVKPRIAALQSEYDSSVHAQFEIAKANAALVDTYDLTEFLARRGTVAGPPGHCVERFAELAEAGVHNVIVSQFVSDPEVWMDTFAAEVRPHVD